MGNYEISLVNRLPIGFAIGFSYFRQDENYDHEEVVVYLGLVSIHIKLF